MSVYLLSAWCSEEAAFPFMTSYKIIQELESLPPKDSLFQRRGGKIQISTQASGEVSPEIVPGCQARSGEAEQNRGAL